MCAGIQIPHAMIKWLYYIWEPPRIPTSKLAGHIFQKSSGKPWEKTTVGLFKSATVCMIFNSAYKIITLGGSLLPLQIKSFAVSSIAQSASGPMSCPAVCCIRATSPPRFGTSNVLWSSRIRRCSCSCTSSACRSLTLKYTEDTKVDQIKLKKTREGMQ